ncbi:MAG: histidine--tRNA ligase [Candidatus Omnitrophica bacterium]|nr:histidine--tRNA ligase [Candidatus Omnitrophota bacterium]
MKYQAIRGTKDILPAESALWQKVEAVSRGLFRLFNYREIRTPVIEDTGLFVKSVGEDTDIVKKEMFSFVDRGERNISLRPEGTAPVVRAYIENNLFKTEPFQKLYYIGPMFRAERPQAGRMRQFHQIGVEVIGSKDPVVDAEVITIASELLKANGATGYEIRLNNLGCPEDKKKLSTHLKEALADSSTSKLLCDDCKRRSSTNPLRVIDCKNESCRTSVRSILKKADFLCEACKSHFKEVVGYLDSTGIKYIIDPYIVRGLDYYTGTVFEITQTGLGAQNAIGAGGRYDKLISDMGGPEFGACGFAIGADRLMMALGSEAANSAAGDVTADIFIASMGKAASGMAFLLARELRANGVSCDIDFENRSLKSQMRSADSMKAKYVLIIGDDELAKGEVTLRNMVTKEQASVKFQEIVGRIKSLL